MTETQRPSKEALENQRLASGNAKDRARAATWDVNIAVFLFAVLIIVIILLFQEIRIEIVASVAIFGLAMVWLVGRRQGKQLYERFYNDELLFLEAAAARKEAATVEEQIQKALRERAR